MEREGAKQESFFVGEMIEMAQGHVPHLPPKEEEMEAGGGNTDLGGGGECRECHDEG